MSADNHSTRHYWIIWGVLLAALLISLGLGAYTGSHAVIAVIFAIAGVKALLVLMYFMHLNIEMRHLKVVMAGALIAVLCFLGGTFPDVGRGWSVITPEAAAKQAAALAAKGGEAGPGDAARGEKVYGTICVGCHAADGRANGGKTAASFVDDKTRLAKSDDELLTSIRDGKTGPVGTMPPWKSALTEQQMRDALAYVRATFGAAH